MPRAPRSYGEAITAAQALLRVGRLADPGEHFPYRHQEVTALVEANPPMGPAGPDDDRVRVEDYMSQAIADASAAYIDAQGAYLADPGDARREVYDRARDELLAARAAHRVYRDSGGTIVGIRARRAGE